MGFHLLMPFSDDGFGDGDDDKPIPSWHFCALLHAIFNFPSTDDFLLHP
jgi:hypothetical protein